MIKEYIKLKKVESSIIEVENVNEASFGEVVEVKSSASDKSMVGKVVNINDDTVTIQVFGDSTGMSTQNTKVRFTQRPFEIAL